MGGGEGEGSVVWIQGRGWRVEVVWSVMFPDEIKVPKVSFSPRVEFWLRCNLGMDLGVK